MTALAPLLALAALAVTADAANVLHVDPAALRTKSMDELAALAKQKYDGELGPMVREPP